MSPESDLRKAENDAIANKEPSYYTGSGRDPWDRPDSRKEPWDDANKAPWYKLNGKKKGVAAFIVAILLFGGLGIFLGGSNALLAPALSALMTSNTQTSYTSYTLRTKWITKNMMDDAGGGAVKNGFTGKLKYANIPTKFRNRLSKYGIEVSGSGKNTRLSWNGIDNIDADQFVKMYNDNPQFREAYTNAKRGRVATFFDNVAIKIYNKLGLSRNWFAKYKQSSDAEADMKNYRGTLSPKFENNTSTIRTNAETEKPRPDPTEPDGFAKDENGNIIYDKVTEVEGGTAKPGDAADATNKAHGLVGSLAKSAASLGSGICGLLKIGNTIAIMVAANEIYQSINYFMGQMESISKMKAGYGDESAVNSVLNFLSTSATTQVPDYDKITVNTSSQTSTSAEEVEANQKVETGSPLEAPTVQNILANAPVSASDTTNYSLERSIKKMGGAMLFSGGANAFCAGVDAVKGIISIASAVGSFGISMIANFVFDAVFSFIAASAVTAFLGFLIPTIARSLFTNVFDNAKGVVAGHLLAQGASAANMREGRSGSGQSPSGEAQINAFVKSTQEVLALEAEVDRLRLSPFDTSNKNTFFGSIAYSLLPTITSSSTTGLASFIRSASTSLSSLTSSVYAATEGVDTYLTHFGDCPLLDEIGAKGDLYCNPIVTTDMNTIEMSPDDDTFQKVLMSAGEGADGITNLTCEDDGSCKVNKNSNLAKYISYCDGRDSPFGVVDQNILGNLEKGNTLVNSIPIIGDAVDILNGLESTKNIPWATGERCGNTTQNSDFWQNEGKYYQRYIEDQRILEQMGAYEGSQNPVLAYEEEFEKEHPTDNTYIGYLSRISGLTPENTETVLAAIEYYDFVNNYDDSNRIAFDGTTTDYKSGEEVIAEINSSIIRFEDAGYVQNPLETNTVAHQHIIYYDIRNRSYAA